MRSIINTKLRCARYEELRLNLDYLDTLDGRKRLAAYVPFLTSVLGQTFDFKD